MCVQQEPRSTWYLDSACSNHMTGSKEFFVSLGEGYTSKVKLGDGKFHDIKGKGVVAVESKGGNSKLIYDVHYVLGLATNLLSLGQLSRKGYKINFDDDEGKIIDKKNNSIVAKVKMNSKNVFPLIMPLAENFAFKTEKIVEAYLWHLIYGHLNYNGLKLLKDKNMVLGLPPSAKLNQVCEGYIYGKMHRLPFPKTAWRARAP